MEGSAGLLDATLHFGLRLKGDNAAGGSDGQVHPVGVDAAMGADVDGRPAGEAAAAHKREFPALRAQTVTPRAMQEVQMFEERQSISHDVP